MQTISRLYDSYSTAQKVVSELEAAGFGSDHVSLVASREGDSSTTGSTTGDVRNETGAFDGKDDAAEGASAGATIGAAVSGAAGLLAGLGMLAIPGIGPVVAAGWLASAGLGAAAGAVGGAATGGLLGALTDSGHSKDDAEYYAEGVRRGGALVTVRADESMLSKAKSILDRHNASDMETTRSQWRNEGWTGFDPNAPTYTRTATTTTRRIA